MCLLKARRKENEQTSWIVSPIRHARSKFTLTLHAEWMNKFGHLIYTYKRDWLPRTCKRYYTRKKEYFLRNKWMNEWQIENELYWARKIKLSQAGKGLYWRDGKHWGKLQEIWAVEIGNGVIRDQRAVFLQVIFPYEVRSKIVVITLLFLWKKFLYNIFQRKGKGY